MDSKVNFPEPSKTMYVNTDQLENLLWVKNEEKFAKKYNVVEELIISPGNSQNKPEVKYCGASYFPSLKRAVLEEGIEEIGSFAFTWSSIKSIKMPSTLKRISYAAFSKSAIETIEWPDKVDGLVIDGDSAWYAFDYCINLKELVFPEGTTFVAVPTYLTPNVERIHLPSSVKDLYVDGSLAVGWTPSLKELTWGDKVLIDADNDVEFEKENYWDKYAIKDGELVAHIVKDSYRREHMEKCKKECLAFLVNHYGIC